MLATKSSPATRHGIAEENAYAPKPVLEQVLHFDGKTNPIDEIRIVLISPKQFPWSLWRSGREVFAGVGDAEQVASMAHVTELLVNTELGVATR